MNGNNCQLIDTNWSRTITKINESNSYTLESLGNVNATSTASESDEYGQFIFSKYVKESLKILNTGTIDRYTDLWATHELTHSRQKFIKPFFHYKKAKVSERRFEMYTSPKIIFAKMAIRCEAFFDIRGEFASINTNCFYKPFKVTTSLAFIASRTLFTFSINAKTAL